MKQYRCYLYDRNAHTVAVRTARHASDAKAVRWARELHATHPEYPAVEVWHSDRLIWQLDATTSKQKRPPRRT